MPVTLLDRVACPQPWLLAPTVESPADGLIDAGVEPFATSPAEFGRFIVGDTERWTKVIRAANIKPA